MDRLSVVMQSTFSQTGPPRRVDCLVRCGSIQVSFPMTQRCNAQFRDRTGSRQPCGCQLALLSTELHHRYLG